MVFPDIYVESKVVEQYKTDSQHCCLTQPLWRNWLARSAVNRKVGGSSPPGGDLFLIITFYMEVTMNVPWQSPIQVLTRLNTVSG